MTSSFDAATFDVIQRLRLAWAAAGVRAGDLLLLHSRTTRLLKHYFHHDHRAGVAAILESVLQALGPEGTLLLPLFNYDFSGKVPFDIRSTPSQIGALTELGRSRRDAVRTGHPIYSFAALGARRDLFSNVVNFSGYGANSPFGILLNNNGKIAVLDLPDQNSMTFYHFVEETLAVDYRYHKIFHGDYTDAKGVTTPRNFGLYVRDIERGIITSVGRMEALLWDEGLFSGERPGTGFGLRVIEASRLFERTATIIRDGKADQFLYEIDPLLAIEARG